MSHVLVQDLRNAVLQAAVQGQLTEQLSTDSDPNALFSNIGFVDGKTIKRKQDNHLAKVSESDISIDIPENWIICRVGDLVSSIDAGKSPKCKNESCSDKEWGVIKTTAIQDNYFVRSENKVLSKSFEIKEKYIIHKNDFLITRAGPRNRTGVICIVNEEPQNLILSDKTLRFNLKHEYVLPAYLRIALRSPFGQSDIEKYMVGMAASQVNISQENMKLFTIPLPPIEEQARIVARVDELMEKIDEYEKIEKELTELQKAFPGNMKDAILQAAMSGLLTERDDGDESVELLIKRIASEQEKNGNKKTFSGYIDGEECLFEIPNEWTYARLSDISTSGLGKTLNAGTDRGDEKPYLCSINVYWDGVNLDKVKSAKFSEMDIQKYKLQPGDLLVCEGGDVGRSIVWESEEEMYYQNALHRVRFFGGVNQYYVKYVLYLYKRMGVLDDASKGMTIKHLVQKALNNLVIPVPPIEEQKRIVQKLDSVLPLCDYLQEVA